jgi:hypothetical protein
VAFAPGANAARLVQIARLALPPVAILLVYTLAIGSEKPLALLLALHLVGLTVAALMCHARLAEDRPPPSGLTEFYLWVALGGVLGGVFNAIVAPVVLPTLIEYPAAIVAAVLLRPAGEKKRPDLLEFFLRDPRPTKLMDYLVPLLLGGALAIALELARPSGGGEPSFTARTAIVGLFCGLSLNLARRPIRFGLGLGAILIAASLALVPGEKTLYRDRSFFGIYKVVADAPFHELYDGTTVHGQQRVGSREPLEYFNPAGPAGQVFAHRRGRLGVVGLGAGTMACYRPGATTFFEIDPAVVRIARNPRLFTYLRDCPARVVVGDGRLSLSRERAKFDVLAIDAFNSDAIPIHLITREAVELYFNRVTPGGLVLFHISNRYVRLEPVLASIARDLGLQCSAQRHVPTPAQQERGYAISKWAVLSRQPAALGARWHACQYDGTRVWTDDYSDLLGAMNFG